MSKLIVLLALFGALSFSAVVACDDAGSDFDEAVEEVQDEADDTADEIKDEVDDLR